ncbi:MAG: DUF2267 domain-containing protein [Cytophagaceae bacterium]|nr:DUF2267 domain-containing protein [Cytophagaceae bacterium]
MDSIVKLVAEKTGISESQAKVAVDTVAGYLKTKLPAGVGSQVDSFLGGSGSTGGLADGLKDGLGGLFK